jgi:hypothetical protein
MLQQVVSIVTTGSKWLNRFGHNRIQLNSAVVESSGFVVFVSVFREDILDVRNNG